MTGTVKRFDLFRGFGFVRRDDGLEDVFVHAKNVQDHPRELIAGERVAFNLGKTDRASGRPEAINVRRIRE